MAKTEAEVQNIALRQVANSLGIAGAMPTDIATARGKFNAEERAALDKALGSMSDANGKVTLDDTQVNKRVNDYLSHAGPATLRDFTNTLGVNLHDVYSRTGMEAPINSISAINVPGAPQVAAKKTPFKSVPVNESDKAASQLKDLLNQITTKINPAARAVGANAGVIGGVASGVDNFLKAPDGGAHGLTQLISDLTKKFNKADAGKAGTKEDAFIRGLGNNKSLKGIFGAELPFDPRNRKDRERYLGGLFSPHSAVVDPTTGRKFTVDKTGALVEVSD